MAAKSGSLEMEFLGALQNAFGQVSFVPVADGVVHRFHVPGDKRNTVNGWYVLSRNGTRTGTFGSWRSGETRHWSSRVQVAPHEMEQMRQCIEQSRRRHEAEQHLRQKQASEYAAWRWKNACRADPAHPYLRAKQVCPHGLRQHQDELLVPLSFDGVLANLQRINANGGKRFLRGGRTTGCYFLFGSIVTGCTIYVCEGWATGASIHESTGSPVVCAMSARNLKAVAIALRSRYGDSVELIIAGDDDRQTQGNPGRAHAVDAAIATGALVTFPDWPANSPTSLTDFNDLICWRLRHE